MIDFTAFAHGQVQSKLWLCEELEKYIPEPARVLILGSWYGVLNFMLMTRNPNKYELMTSIDKDADAMEVSKKILSAWTVLDDNKHEFLVKDLDQPFVLGTMYDVVINCSPEHMSSHWFSQVKEHQLMCIQTSNRVTDDPSWDVKNPNPTMSEFKAKYPMSQILFEGERVFDYGHLCYSRYMLIGRK